MLRPLLRVSSWAKAPRSCNRSSESHLELNTEMEDVDRSRSYLSVQLPVDLLVPDHSSLHKGISEKNGLLSHWFSLAVSRNGHQVILFLIKAGLASIIILALMGLLLWAVSISTLSRVNTINSHRMVERRYLSDLRDIVELPFGPARLKELEFCSQQSENFVPCFNVSENTALGHSGGDEHDRHCKLGMKQNCLVPAPVNYKAPLRWPTGRDVIWVANVKITALEVLMSGSLTKRMMMLEEEQISFRSASVIFDGMEDYAHQIADMIGLRNESNFIQAGVTTVLDIGCGYGSFGAHLFSNHILTLCIANYEVSGSQVQLTLERGLPAMIGSFISKQLPYPSLSFDMIHCARCGVDWETKEGIFLIEVDRLLKPGGYFVWTSPQTNPHGKENHEKWNFVCRFTKTLCWDFLSQQDETMVWEKTIKKKCHVSRRPGIGPSICRKDHDMESSYYQSLQACMGGTRSRRWIPITGRPAWPNRAKINSSELQIYDVNVDNIAEDDLNWNLAVHNYWSLLTPLIFSDHPKRPGEEDPSPPHNMLRNVMDMNARFGGFNSALLEAGKSVWVMNVVPSSVPNYLPLIVDRGFLGVLHDWCEAFPTYPRTYDMVHGEGLLSFDMGWGRRCTVLHLFTEIDRLLRPEGWVILRDAAALIESVRPHAAQLRWDSRVVGMEGHSKERLLVCQKPLIKKHAPSR